MDIKNLDGVMFNPYPGALPGYTYDIMVEDKHFCSIYPPERPENDNAALALSICGTKLVLVIWHETRIAVYPALEFDREDRLFTYYTLFNELTEDMLESAFWEMTIQ